MKESDQKYSSPYCLHCYAPLERFSGASAPCDVCGKPNLHVDMGRLWTREKKLREVEDLLKALVCISMAALGAVALTFPGVGLGRGHGMGIGAPILLGILLWDVASITRCRSLFRADIIWPIIGVLLCPPVLMAFLAMAKNDGMSIFYGAAALVVVVMIPAILAPLLRRAWLRWCANRIAAAQAQTQFST